VCVVLIKLVLSFAVAVLTLPMDAMDPPTLYPSFPSAVKMASRRRIDL